MSGLLDELKTIHDKSLGICSPLFLVSVIGVYLLFVLQIGPKLMKNREPFKLKEFIFAYNIIQIVSCIYLVTAIWDLASWSLFDFSQCHAHLPNTEGGTKYDYVTFMTFWLKIFELMDTVVFVMRKKQNQITFLHVFHHSSTITVVFFLSRYHKVNNSLYPIYINCWVHIIMYTYYFFSNICSAEVMKKFVYIKKSITIIQMIQFCLILAQAAITWSSCNIPFILIAYFFFVVLVIFYGFYDFYKKTYQNSQANKLSNNKSK